MLSETVYELRDKKNNKIVTYATKMAGYWYYIPIDCEYLYCLEVDDVKLEEAIVSKGKAVRIETIPEDIFKCFVTTSLTLSDMLLYGEII